MKQAFKLWLQHKWYQKKLSAALWVLVPFAWILSIITALYKAAYTLGVFKRHAFKIPIIIVGNITVGGTGKTPLVIHIVKLLQQHGFCPGVVSRGYKGTRSSAKPIYVYANSNPNEVGDEPVLLAKRLLCPIAIATNRPKAVEMLIGSNQVDVVISDDGLQHFALAADIEVLVIDGRRRFGNGWCLPAGPLRESLHRLKTVDYIVANSPDIYDNDSEFEMELRPRVLYNGLDPENQLPLIYFKDQTVHAVAGIGYPDRFFELLQKQGIHVITHSFPDHYSFSEVDLQFQDELPVIMTEKDAVKCAGFMKNTYWILSVDAVVNPLFDLKLLTRLQELKRG
jgi:tetraacyldisaccharide 4'-kinase